MVMKLYTDRHSSEKPFIVYEPLQSFVDRDFSFSRPAICQCFSLGNFLQSFNKLTSILSYIVLSHPVGGGSNISVLFFVT